MDATGPQAWILKVPCYYSSLAELEVSKYLDPIRQQDQQAVPRVAARLPKPISRPPSRGWSTAGLPVLWPELWYQRLHSEFPWGLWQAPRGPQPPWVISFHNNFGS